MKRQVIDGVEYLLVPTPSGGCAQTHDNPTCCFYDREEPCSKLMLKKCRAPIVFCTPLEYITFKMTS